MSKLELGELAAPPALPELPEGARPRWPAWHAPTALFGGFAAVVTLGLVLFPVFLLAGLGETAEAVALLLALIVQDGVLMAGALFLAWTVAPPRLWHFGVRKTKPLKPILWAVLAFAVILAFEIAWIEYFDVGEGNVEELGDNSPAGFWVCLAVIVVAPVSEEFFFRGFFYRALRTRFRVWSASLIDALVFASLHYQGTEDSALALPIIAVFGLGMCLIYEYTGSLFPVIAVHAAFNTFAMLGQAPIPAVMIGLTVITACVLVPRKLHRDPSPMLT